MDVADFSSGGNLLQDLALRSANDIDIWVAGNGQSDPHPNNKFRTSDK